MSKDVIHDFFLPNFRAQLYAVPGMVGRFVFTPTTTTADLERASRRTVPVDACPDRRRGRRRPRLARGRLRPGARPGRVAVRRPGQSKPAAGHDPVRDGHAGRRPTPWPARLKAAGIAVRHRPHCRPRSRSSAPSSAASATRRCGPSWSSCRQAEFDRRFPAAPHGGPHRTAVTAIARRALSPRRPASAGSAACSRPTTRRSACTTCSPAWLLRPGRPAGDAHAVATGVAERPGPPGAGARPPARLGPRRHAAGRVQRHPHAARHGDDLPRADPAPKRGVRQLPPAAQDRGPRHGLPGADRPVVLAVPGRRRDPAGRRLPARRGRGHRLDGLPAAQRRHLQRFTGYAAAGRGLLAVRQSPGTHLAGRGPSSSTSPRCRCCSPSSSSE